MRITLSRVVSLGLFGLLSACNPEMNLDECTSNPCQNGGICTDATSGFTCSCAAGFTGATCELELCDQTTIRSHADLDAARACAEIHGNLSLLGGATEITGSDLPNLKKITGDLTITTFGAQMPYIEKVSLSALQSVEGSVVIAGNSRARVVSLPNLTTIGKPGTGSKLQVQEIVLGRLDLPRLSSVYGDVILAQANYLCSANLPALSSVSGGVTLFELPNLGYSSLARLQTSGTGSAMVQDVGCCTVSDAHACDSAKLPGWDCGDPINCP